MEAVVQSAYAQFDLPGELVSIAPLGNGLINRTFEVVQSVDGETKRYVMQQINHQIFPNVAGLMQNIVLVTNFLKEKIKSRGGDPNRETLTVIPSKTGAAYVVEDGTYWRIYPFIEGTYTLESVTNEAEFFEAGRSFGAFQAELDGFDASQLTEVIPKFHDTRDRYQQFLMAVQEDRAGRVASVQDLIDFIQARQADCYLLYDLLDAGELPLRVTHNDTKLNNILMDQASGKGLCIVDLDTIMPGLVLFDFGDAIRFGANHNAEDESDMSKVNFDIELYAVYAKGFLTGIEGRLTAKELELLPWGARVITLEQGIRFLTDYLNGDVYYGTSRPGQNLDRTRTQLKLVADMEAQWAQMQAVLQEVQAELAK